MGKAGELTAGKLLFRPPFQAYYCVGKVAQVCIGCDRERVVSCRDSARVLPGGMRLQLAWGADAP